MSIWKKCTIIKVASQLNVSYTTSRVLWLMHFLNTDIRFSGPHICWLSLLLALLLLGFLLHIYFHFIFVTASSLSLSLTLSFTAELREADASVSRDSSHAVWCRAAEDKVHQHERADKRSHEGLQRQTGHEYVERTGEGHFSWEVRSVFALMCMLILLEGMRSYEIGTEMCLRVV